MTEEEALWLDENDAIVLDSIPESQRIDVLCMVAVRRDGLELKHVPASSMSESLCLEAIRENPNAIEYVPDALLTPAVCLATVQLGGFALEYIPLSLRTDEVCRAAVHNEGSSLRFVPEALRSADLCRLAVVSSGFALTHVPAEIRRPVLADILANLESGGVTGALMLTVLRLKDVSLLKQILVSDSYCATRYQHTTVVAENTELIKATLREIELDKMAVSAAPAAKKARL